MTRADASQLIDNLREQGKDGTVGILYIILMRKSISAVGDLIKEFNSNAFSTIGDMRFVSNGIQLPDTEIKYRPPYRPR